MGAAGTGGVSLPAAPQADDTCPRPRRAGGNGSSLCLSSPCPVTAPKPVSGYWGCAVSSDRDCCCSAPPLSSLTHARGNFFCSKIPFPALYLDKFCVFPEMSVSGVGMAGWSQLAGSSRLGRERSAASGQAGVSHPCRAPPRPTLGPAWCRTCGCFCAPTLEMRGKESQGVGQRRWKASEHRRDRHSTQRDPNAAAAEPFPSCSPMRNPLQSLNCPRLYAASHILIHHERHHDRQPKHLR